MNVNDDPAVDEDDVCPDCGVADEGLGCNCPDDEEWEDFCCVECGTLLVDGESEVCKECEKL